MKTYQDLLKQTTEVERMAFIQEAINEHKASKAVQTAKAGSLYAIGENETIKKYQKVLYTLTGQAVPDNYTANHKCASGFFKRFVTQETSYLLKNGVAFEKDETYKKLGADFNQNLYKAVKNALAQGVAFGFFNYDKVVFFKLTEFVPLYDEDDGALKAGIRFWQIDESKPLRATLYELDGYTDYIQREKQNMQVLNAKKTYKQIVKRSQIDGEQIYNGDNYPTFPIVPLWGNSEKQSELVGIREQIDCYDLIKSGFANDLDDASMIYWTLTNAGGMDDVSLAQFIERMHTVKASVIDGDDGAKAEAHTMDVPYQSREVYLTRLEKDLYRDYMALDTSQIAGGNVTATQIEAAYDALDEKVFDLQTCITDFLQGIFYVAGIEDTPKYNPSRIINRREEVEIVMMAAEYLDDQTILEKLPFLTDAEVEGVLQRTAAEEVGRMKPLGEEAEEDVASVDEAINKAEEATSKTLNGAQTQSLIAVMAQYSSGALTEGQAVAIVSTAIGVSREEARAIIKGE